MEFTLFDLNILPFPIKPAGLLQIPGLLVVPPTRKATRGRENDLLIIYFSLNGQSPITNEGLRTWLEKKSETYHQTAGPVTAGMRALAEEINSDLLDRNTRHAPKGGQVSGNLLISVVKKDMLYRAVAGQGKAFFVSDDQTQIESPENAKGGLGVSSTAELKFAQTMIKSGDVLLLTNDPPHLWTTDSLVNSHRLSNEALVGHLFGQGVEQSHGVLIRITEGNGRVKAFKLHENTAVDSEKTLQEEKTINTVIPSPVKDQLIIQKDESPIQPSTDKVMIARPSIKADGFAQEKNIRPETQEENLSVSPAFDETKGNHYSTDQGQPKSDTLKKVVGGALREGVKAKHQADSWMKKALQKTLPGDSNQPLQFSRGVMIFLAVAIPVIVVAVAISFYIRNGRENLYNGYIALAQQAATNAVSQNSDQNAMLSSLNESIFWLDKADKYGNSNESEDLRNQVQSGLDQLEGVIRVEMIPAIGVLSSDTKITQLAVSGTDLYALDENTGKVFRFTLSGSEYLQDTAFDCGPADTGGVGQIGKLVDMVPLAGDNTYGASLLAIDSQGMLDYCVPESSGYIKSLSQPDMGWGEVKSISLNEGNLYVLDIRGNAVYTYDGTDDDFLEKPTLFFDETIPSLNQAVDIEVNGYELYILRSTGEMVECTYSALKDMKSTECEDPAKYTDNRTGSGNAQTAVISGATLMQMHLTPVPDSSLYFLDSNNKGIYHFSYARNLQEVVYPRIEDGEALENSAVTAFTVSTTRRVFMAYGNQIFYGQLP